MILFRKKPFALSVHCSMRCRNLVSHKAAEVLDVICYAVRVLNDAVLSGRR